MSGSKSKDRKGAGLDAELELERMRLNQPSRNADVIDDLDLGGSSAAPQRDPDVGQSYSLVLEHHATIDRWRLRESIVTIRGLEERMTDWLPFEEFAPHFTPVRGNIRAFVFDRQGYAPPAERVAGG